MEDILDLLYNAHLGYNNRPFGPESPFYKAVRIRAENEELLQKQLTEEQNKWLKALVEAERDIHEFCSYRKFTYGFHLGTLFMQAVAQGEKEMLGA